MKRYVLCAHCTTRFPFDRRFLVHRHSKFRCFPTQVTRLQLRGFGSDVLRTLVAQIAADFRVIDQFGSFFEVSEGETWLISIYSSAFLGDMCQLASCLGL